MERKGRKKMPASKKEFEQKRKQEEKTIKKLAFQEKFYKRTFYFIEFGYLLFGIPAVILAMVAGPILTYYIATQRRYLWPFFVVGGVIAFFQILAAQFLIRKYLLEPYDMTLGEYLRFRLDKKERERRSSKLSPKKYPNWYSNMDELITRTREERREKTRKIFAMYKTEEVKERHL